jgi:hypothetical protein
VTAQQRHVEPAQLPRRKRGKLGVDVRRCREQRAGDIARLDSVDADHQAQQLPRRNEDFLALVMINRRRAAYTSAIHNSHIV